MGSKTLMQTTTNRGEFNRAYKLHLEQTGKIKCSYCGYHSVENNNDKWYGGIIYDDMETCSGKRKGTNTRYPNWKLVSKNRKQWMKKPIKFIEDIRINHERIYVEIKFST